jgi:hypothetical protein
VRFPASFGRIRRENIRLRIFNAPSSRRPPASLLFVKINPLRTQPHLLAK